MYEIFDYLDNYHIYESFFDLNKRFKKLLIKSTLPFENKYFIYIKIKFSSLLFTNSFFK